MSEQIERLSDSRIKTQLFLLLNKKMNRRLRNTSWLFIFIIYFLPQGQSMEDLSSIENFETGIEISSEEMSIVGENFNPWASKLAPLSYDQSNNDKDIVFSFGVLAGVSYYILDKTDLVLRQNDQDRYKIKVKEADLGIHFGLMMELHIRKILIRPEIVFNSNTINYQVDDLNNSSVKTLTKEKYQVMDIPLMFGYKSNALRLMTGPVAHVFLSRKSELAELENFSRKNKSLTLGWQAGLGIDFWNFMFDIRYEGNFDKLGDGLKFNNEKIYFSKAPSRIIATLSFAIY